MTTPFDTSAQPPSMDKENHPPPNENIATAGSPTNLSTPLTEKEKKALEKDKKKAWVKVQKRRLIDEANLKERRNHPLAPVAITTPEFKPYIRFDDDLKPIFNVGDYVRVERDMSPGKNRQEGYGFVQKVSGVGAATLTTVRMSETMGDGRTHKDIPLSHITPAIFFGNIVSEETTPPKRKRKAVAVLDCSPPEKKAAKDDRSPLEKLVDTLQDGALKSKQKGWYLKMIRGTSEGPKRMTDTEDRRLLHEAALLSSYSAIVSKPVQKKSKEGKFKKTSAKSKGATLTYLVETAYGKGKGYLVALKKRAKRAGNDGIELPPKNQRKEAAERLEAATEGYNCVIENREMAKEMYTAKYLYTTNRCREAIANYENQSRDDHIRRQQEAAEEYDKLNKDEKMLWEMKAREHDEKQPHIKYIIIEHIKKNPKISWHALEKRIDYWCSASTIWRWVTSFAGYKCYCERVVPMLSEAQRKSHLEFASRFRMNWNLGPGKYLLVMYDEKWFWGLVMRRYAKACKELGIEQHNYSAYHKNHINKVMAIAFTAFAFVDSIENGGVAEKLAFIRAQGKKVASKTQKKGVRQPNGSIRYCGDIIRQKNDVYNVDCAVTGSNNGSVDDPKCPLLPIFKDIIFPMVEAMVAPSGKYPGYTVVFQGDNAGPHQDATFLNGVRDHCRGKGWHWEPQAAQMPHMNVLDLSVFPCMSRRHIARSRECGGLHVLDEDQIWETANHVWNNLENDKISSAYIQAYRIADKVIKAKGSNDFLGNGGSIHTDVRKDFYKTDAGGLARKDKKRIAAPPVPLVGLVQNN